MPKKRSAAPRPPRGRRAAGSGSAIYEGRLYHGWARSQPHSSFPDRTVVSLDYWSTNRVNPGVVTYQDTIFRTNGCFDPELTGAGHQPREWDTWTSIYAKYRVLKTMVEVHVRQRAAHGITVTVVPSNSSTALVLTDYPQELPRAVMLGITGSSQPVCHWRGVIDNRAILGMTQEEFRGDDSTAALVTADPAQGVYLHVFAAQLDGTTVCDFEFAIRFRYEVEFYDRKVLSPSALAAAYARVSARLELLEEVAADEAAEPPPPAPQKGTGGAAGAAVQRRPRV